MSIARTTELFELELLGGTLERRYRKTRPEVEAMPWDSLRLEGVDETERVEAQKAWTGAAFQEHRTAAGCAATLKALIEARAPLDLIAGFARFPLDEIVHVELCSRMAMAIGGATELWHEPTAMISDADPTLTDPLHRAVELVVRNFCVGESLSIPLLHGAWTRAAEPLSKAVLGRIVRDEAAHGVFGWIFLDWALPLLDEKGWDLIRRTAVAAIGEIQRLWDDVARRPATVSGRHGLGWLSSLDYIRVARQSLRSRVLTPFALRGLELGQPPRAVAGADGIDVANRTTKGLR
jgi:hypothetical protein